MITAISGKKNSGKDEVGKIIQYLTHPLSKELTYEQFKNREVFHLTDWKVKKFADKLKDIVCLLIGCTRADLEDEDFKNKELGEDWWKYKILEGSVFRWANLDKYRETSNNQRFIVKLTPRKLLQLLGTECGRDIIHPDIWVNSLMGEYKPCEKHAFSQGRNPGRTFKSYQPKYPKWIITDLRFPNELEAVKKRDGLTIRVNRFKVGDIVYWDDPEMGLSSGVYKITQVDEEMAHILQMDSMSEAQVPLWEISLFKDPEHYSETALDSAEFDYTIDNSGTLEELVEKVREILLEAKVISSTQIITNLPVVNYEKFIDWIFEDAEDFYARKEKLLVLLKSPKNYPIVKSFFDSTGYIPNTLIEGKPLSDLEEYSPNIDCQLKNTRCNMNKKEDL